MAGTVTPAACWSAGHRHYPALAARMSVCSPPAEERGVSNMFLCLLPLPPEVLLHGLLLRGEDTLAALHGGPPLLLLGLPGQDQATWDPVVLQLLGLVLHQLGVLLV